MAKTFAKILKAEDEPPSIKSKTTLILDYLPSCLEFWPLHPEYFVIGTYLLQSNPADDEQTSSTTQTRSGNLILFRLEGQTLQQICIKPTPYAVLDLRFAAHKPDANVFAVASSVGAVHVYSLIVEENGLLTKEKFLVKLHSFQICEPLLLILSLTWMPCDKFPSTIAFSMSDGRVGLLSFGQSQHALRLVRSHAQEAWTIAWSTAHSHNDTAPELYSGGDDSMIVKHRGWLCSEGGFLDVSSSEGNFPNSLFADGTYTPLIQDSKTHTAGVTAILPVPKRGEASELVVTGSYDEQIRLLALSPQRKRAIVLAEKRLHGGVWRLKPLVQDNFHDEEWSAGFGIGIKHGMRFRVLASCMHAGVSILGFRESEEGVWSVEILAKFTEHESMNYASDVRPSLAGEDGDMTVVSSSFYDRKLCVWNF